jgi:ABC-2 type transport system permease protein
MMFWTLIFPVVLATLFNFAFSNLNDHEIFRSVPLAVVDNQAYRDNPMLAKTLTSVSGDGSASGEDAPFFNLHLVTLEKAEEMLDAGEVAGMLNLDGGLHLYFKESGMNQTIIKSFFDQYLQTTSMVTSIIAGNPDAHGQGLFEALGAGKTRVEEVNASPVSPDNTLVYFYTIIAMACFYGGFQGMKEVNAIQANLSRQAARVNVSPTRKLKIFLTSLSAATLVQFVAILLLLAYLGFVIKVDFGPQTGYILLFCLSGCITGVAFGTMVGVLVKGGEGVKTGIMIGTTMVLSFLAGMMFVQVKYAVTDAVPALAYLNPVNVITDGFYALYYYETHTRYFINLGLLWAFTALFSVVSVFRLRRLKYASI